MTKEEVNLLLLQPKTDNFKGIRDKAMLELLYATGIRVSELVALDLDNLDLDSGYLYIRESENNDRTIPIGTYALEYLSHYIKNYREKVLRDKEEKAVFLNFSGGED